MTDSRVVMIEVAHFLCDCGETAGRIYKDAESIDCGNCIANYFKENGVWVRTDCNNCYWEKKVVTTKIYQHPEYEIDGICGPHLHKKLEDIWNMWQYHVEEQKVELRQLNAGLAELFSDPKEREAWLAARVLRGG